MQNLNAYLAKDRLHALAIGQNLPETGVGAALFADISGFTALTEALTRELGVFQGAEELTYHLNLVYDALIAEVERYGGSVIGFSGDAITCWFAGDERHAARRAVASGLAMLTTIQQSGQLKTPSGHILQLALKAGVAAGFARRFVVGDAQYNFLDVLAGATLERMAAAERMAQQGELLVAPEVSALLGQDLVIRQWRRDEGRALNFALVAALKGEVAPQPWPPLPDKPVLDEAALKPWLLPAVYARLQAGQGNFLAELRPAVALFLRFGSLDYDHDAAASTKLDAYIRWLERVVAQYDGALIQLTIGDKGNFLYITFGAPVAHENDIERAVRSSLELARPPTEFDWLNGVQIGISQGIMRTGAYGGSTRRTYGVIGDAANLAARLMQIAHPGEVLASGRVRLVAGDKWFSWQNLGEITLRGKTEPMPIYQLCGKNQFASRSPELITNQFGNPQLLPLKRQPDAPTLNQPLRAIKPAIKPAFVPVENIESIEAAISIPNQADFSVTATLPADYYAKIINLWSQGYPEQALKVSSAALEGAAQANKPDSLAWAYYFKLKLHYRRFELPVVQQLAEELMTIAIRHQFLNWQTIAMLYSGWARAEQGQFEAGKMQILQGQALQEIVGFEAANQEGLLLLSRVHLKAGEIREALKTLAEALAVSKAADREGEIYQLKGECLLALSSVNAHLAEECFQQALVVHRQQQAKSLELRTATSIARLWQQQGRFDEAYQLLAPVYSWFNEGFDTHDLQEAKTLLESIAASPFYAALAIEP